MLKHLALQDRLFAANPSALFAPSPTAASRDDVTHSDRSQHDHKLRAAVAVRGSTRTTTRPRSTVVHRAPQGCQLARTVRGAL